jgi:hypothetical protein
MELKLYKHIQSSDNFHYKDYIYLGFDGLIMCNDGVSFVAANFVKGWFEEVK